MLETLACLFIIMSFCTVLGLLIGAFIEHGM